MKKILIALFSLFITSGAYSQIQVGKERTKIETIGNIRKQTYIYKQNGMFYLDLGTSNQFDQPIIFNLGTGKEAALKSCEDLIGLCEELSKDEYVKIIDAEGQNFSIRKQNDNKNGLAIIDFFAEDQIHAGTIGLFKMDINKIKKKIEQYNK